MDNMGDWDQVRNLVFELLQGKELARQLQSILNVSSSSSQEAREALIQKIIATFEKALAMVHPSGGSTAEPSQPTGAAIRMSESPPLSGSPHSEDSDRDLMRDSDQNSLSRKRKSMPRWTKQIRVNPGVGVEGPLDDGYSWRKYGQKDILGAKYPRGYYRCTHRNVQGCLATKQVQRSDEDPTIFEITYRGKHTCTQASNVVPPPSGPQDNPESKPDIDIVPQLQPHIQQQSPELLSSLQASLRVQTENLDSPQQSFAPFHFPSSSNIKTENQAFPLSMMMENNFAENFTSPSYLSPATSGTNYFSSVSPSGFVGNPNFASSGSDINDIISAATSAANSPTVGLEYPFDQMELEQNFTFDYPRFFS